MKLLLKSILLVIIEGLQSIIELIISISIIILFSAWLISGFGFVIFAEFIKTENYIMAYSILILDVIILLIFIFSKTIKKYKELKNEKNILHTISKRKRL